MERTEIFTAKTFDEAKAMASEAFGADVLDIEFEVIEQPVKKLLGMKGEFRVRAIYTAPAPAVAPVTPAAPVVSTPAPAPTQAAATVASNSDDSGCFAPTVEYIKNILTQLGVADYTIDVKKVGDNNVINISGDKLGAVIGRRGETLDSLQYLAVLTTNRESNCEDSERPRLLVDCNGYREKRAETLEALAVRTANKVIKQGRRLTLEPMNPYERRIIHSKVSSIDGVFSNSIGEEPYRKVVISAEVVKRRSHGDSDRNRSGNSRDRDRNRRNDRNNERDKTVLPVHTPGAVSNAVQSKSYKQSSGFSTSFEREYKRSVETEISQDTVDFEKSASLYGKIEL